MPASRYNFTIHPKVRVGRLIGVAFLTSYFQQDSTAIAFAAWLEPLLANYATISVSKVIQEAASNEIPTSHTMEDTEDRKLILTNSTDNGYKLFLTLPGLKPGADISGITALDLCNVDGTKFYDTLAVSNSLGKNVIQGGPYDQ